MYTASSVSRSEELDVVSGVALTKATVSLNEASTAALCTEFGVTKKEASNEASNTALSVSLSKESYMALNAASS